jgi:hypothetical protein
MKKATSIGSSTTPTSATPTTPEVRGDKQLRRANRARIIARLAGMGHPMASNLAATDARVKKIEDQLAAERGLLQGALRAAEKIVG